MSAPADRQAAPADGAPLDKAFATARARLALRGYSLHELADGSFLASRWNLTRPLPDLRAVQAFIEAVGG